MKTAPYIIFEKILEENHDKHVFIDSLASNNWGASGNYAHCLALEMAAWLIL